MENISWYYKNTEAGQSLIIDEKTGETIAVVYDQKNAAIISEAPSLLATLKYIEGRLPARDTKSISQARARIMEGEPP